MNGNLLSNTIYTTSTKSKWILGPSWDLSLIVLPPLFIIPLILTIQNHISVESLGIWILGLGGFGHHLPSFIRAYSDPGLFRRFKGRFIYAPLFLILGCGILAYNDLNALTLAVVLWGTWHGTLQVYGFLRIYDAAASIPNLQSSNNLSARLDWLMCVGWFVLVLLHSPTKMFAYFTQFYMSGGPLIPPELFMAFRLAWDIGMGLVAVIYVGHIIQRWKTGFPPNWLKLLTMAVAFSFWWYCMISLNNLILGIVMWEIFHDVQYNAVVWRFQRKRVAGDIGPSQFEKVLFGPGPLRLLFYLTLIGAYGYIGVFSSFGDINLPEKMAGDGSSTAWLLRVISVSALLHFYFDGFIWKIRDSSIRQGLGMEENPKQKSPPKILQPNISTSPRFAWQWAILIIPTVMLGYSQYAGSGLDNKGMMLNLAQVVPSSWAAHFMSGTYLKIDGDYLGAERHFREAVKTNPSFDLAHMMLGDILYKNGSVKEAIVEYQETVRLEPSNIEARTNLGYIYLHKGEMKKAEDQFRIAVDAEPEQVETNYGIAAALMNQDKREEAEKYLRKTILLEPRHSAALNYLGEILDSRGDFTEAIEFYRQAFSEDSLNASARNNLQLALAKTRKAPTP